MYRVKSYSPGNFSGFLIASLIIGFLVAIIVYFTFMKRSNAGKLTGFADWLYQFLHFKVLFIEALSKIAYIALSIYFVLFGFYLLFQGSGAGLLVAIIGPIIIRVLYEFALIQIIICKNTSDINNRLNRNEEKQDQQGMPTQGYEQQYGQFYDNQQYTAYEQYGTGQACEPAKQYCMNCGAELKDHDVYCQKCGQKNR